MAEPWQVSLHRIVTKFGRRRLGRRKLDMYDLGNVELELHQLKTEAEKALLERKGYRASKLFVLSSFLKHCSHTFRDPAQL